MALDQSKIGEHIAAQMEALEADYGEDAEIGDICTIVEILSPQGENAVKADIRVRYQGRPHVGIGLLRTAERSLLSGYGGEA